MNQHRLYRTIENLSVRKFDSDIELLEYVLENIINHEEIPIRGGRIWKLESSTGSYRIVRQYGEMDPIKKNFRLNVVEYPAFLQVHQRSASGTPAVRPAYNSGSPVRPPRR